jgi:hypothetical protein
LLEGLHSRRQLFAFAGSLVSIHCPELSPLRVFEPVEDV